MYPNPYENVKFVTKKFEQLISAQGQLVKWEQAIKCTCYSIEHGASDPSCSSCRGRGYYYIKPSDLDIAGEQAKILSNNTIQVMGSPSSVVRVYNKKYGSEYTVQTISNNIIVLNESTLQSHQGIFVDYIESRLHGAGSNPPIRPAPGYTGQPSIKWICNEYRYAAKARSHRCGCWNTPPPLCPPPPPSDLPGPTH